MQVRSGQALGGERKASDRGVTLAQSESVPRNTGICTLGYLSDPIRNRVVLLSSIQVKWQNWSAYGRSVERPHHQGKIAKLNVITALLCLRVLTLPENLRYDRSSLKPKILQR